MGAKHLEQTKNIREILKSCGFKRGEYRISTKFNHATKGYGRTYVFARRKTNEDTAAMLVERGLIQVSDGIYPIFKW